MLSHWQMTLKDHFLLRSCCKNKNSSYIFGISPNSSTSLILNIQTDSILISTCPSLLEKQNIIFETASVGPNLMFQIPEFQKNLEDWEA